MTSTYPEAWALHPPQPGDPDYRRYVRATPKERARIAALAEKIVGPGRLVEFLRTPAAADDLGFEVDERPLEAQVGPLVSLMGTDAGGMDAADLLAMELPPLRMVVPGLLAEGTTVLAAPPKVGKSCLVYQLVVEVAIGGQLLGRRVEPGAALYLALEDGRRRGQDRLRAALAGRTMPRGRLEVRWGSRKIGEGLEDDLAAWLDAHPDAVVVAIDTLQRARPRTNGRRNAYEVDVDDLVPAPGRVP